MKTKCSQFPSKDTKLRNTTDPTFEALAKPETLNPYTPQPLFKPKAGPRLFRNNNLFYEALAWELKDAPARDRLLIFSRCQDGAGLLFCGARTGHYLLFFARGDSYGEECGVFAENVWCGVCGLRV